MPLHIIVGTQWGDEGKGRVVDACAEGAQIVARFNGGDNAGHTVTVGGYVFKLHLLPSGILHPHVTAMMGNGMVINPRTLLEEMDSLRNAGIAISPERLRISHAAHLITPAHLKLDKAVEAARSSSSLGTTGRGIGPAYRDKAARTNLRLADLLNPGFVDLLEERVNEANRDLSLYDAPPLDQAQIRDSFIKYRAALSPHIVDTAAELTSALHAGHTILAEGAQGTLLDVDHGSYPFVTSSSTIAAGAFPGLGLGLNFAREAVVTGVVKAYQTRVGSGPFPTEVTGNMAERLRGTGTQPWDEFGTTTGRPRRVGWLDGVLLRHAARLNGLTSLAVTKMDVLSGLEKILLCNAYQVNGKTMTDPPFCMSILDQCKPVYEELPGWKEDITGIRKRKDLPKAARNYVDWIAELAGVPVSMISVGPERDQLIVN